MSVPVNDLHDDVLFHIVLQSDLLARMMFLYTSKRMRTITRDVMAHDRSSLVSKQKICDEAAKHGYTNILAWAHENNCPINKYTAYCAADNGNLDIIEWLIEKEYKISEAACFAAARKGYLVMLEHVVNRNSIMIDNFNKECCECSGCWCNTYLENNNEYDLEDDNEYDSDGGECGFVHKYKYKNYSGRCSKCEECCGMGGYLNGGYNKIDVPIETVRQYTPRHDNDYTDFFSRMYMHAAFCGYIDIIQWGLRLGYPCGKWGNDALRCAKEKGYNDIVKLLCEQDHTLRDNPYRDNPYRDLDFQLSSDTELIDADASTSPNLSVLGPLHSLRSIRILLGIPDEKLRSIRILSSIPDEKPRLHYISFESNEKPVKTRISTMKIDTNRSVSNRKNNDSIRGDEICGTKEYDNEVASDWEELCKEQ